ncbi:Fanconi anemia group M protein [Eumeta japonica]|uniref:Fanconi anemia group M protein n=1 Tax=Eumeta variegata TaxID=151549 RepID=A0A4C1T6Y9_EUMVA|nr:Fanconi anemia group M protein [Eumeta japonica]
MGHKTYRVLALSATPGSKVEDVIKVVKNLHIAHLELRSENCLDVAPYSHSRKISTTVIPLGAELTQLRNQYVEILDSYAQRLKQLHILPQNIGNLSKGRVVMLYKEYQNRERGARHPQHNYIMKDFTLLISLFHGLELLIKHGSRVFLNFFDEHPEKSWIESDSRLTAFLERLRDDLGINPLAVNRSLLPDGSVPEMPHTLCFGHPKFDILRKVMTEHFNMYKEKNQETKAIVFCEYRESVNLVHCLLLQCRPLIKAQMFVGQGAGKVSQKHQLRVMRGFREGEWNTLVATCVAEEGLDVGSVDLIICFDISTRSPVRLVQRCGRTGRERGGQVYILVTEGREHQILMDCMRQRDGLNQKIHKSKDVEHNLYKFNPRMIPHGFTPECQKMHITVERKNVHESKLQNKKEDTIKNRKGQMDLRNILNRHSSRSNSSKKENNTCSQITQDEFQQLFPEGFKRKNLFLEVEEVWACSKDQLQLHVTKERQELDLATWLEWQRILQPTINIGHSADSEILTELLQYIDTKRFELPASTQNPNPSPLSLESPKAGPSSDKNFDIGDIEDIFADSLPGEDFLNENIELKSNDLSTSDQKNTLDFFGLESVEDIFADTDDGIIIETSANLFSEKSNNTTKHRNNNSDTDLIHPVSPSILSGAYRQRSAISPIHSDIQTPKSINKIQSPNSKLISIKPRRILERTSRKSTNNLTLNNIRDNSNSFEKMYTSEIATQPDFNNTKSLLSITQLVHMINKSDDDVPVPILSPHNLEKNIDQNDDLSVYTTQTNECIINKRIESPTLLTQARRNVINDRGDSSLLSTQADKKIIKERSDSPILLTQAIKSINDRICTPILLTQADKNVINVTSDPSSLLLQADKNVFDEKRFSPISSNFANTILKSNVDGENDPPVISVPHKKFINDREGSPILLTQADKKLLNACSQAKLENEKVNHSRSLIIQDSDSDFEDTTVYDMDSEFESNNFSRKKLYCPLTPLSENPSTSKRKERSSDGEISNFSSPYFTKKRKVSKNENDISSLQEKVKAALKKNNDHLNYTFSQQCSHPQKENISPQSELCSDTIRIGLDEKKSPKEKHLDNLIQKLRIFSREKSNLLNKSHASTTDERTDKNYSTASINTSFEDSDDDFVSNEKNYTKQDVPKKRSQKTKTKANQFLDLEAELSEASHDSGDELTDDSAGSIVDFICDENETLSQQVDMQAHYLNSVKSPVKGIFKIPQLPQKFDVCSQNVNDDEHYEMDSFCVDSHIGLTQINDMSELEIAEKRLEAKRRKRNRRKRLHDCELNPISLTIERESSIVAKRKTKYIKRQINSDSDDSN